MTSIRSGIRQLSRRLTPVQCSVTVESVAPVSEGFVRVTVGGAGLAAYLDPRPADAFKLFLPPERHGAIAFPGRDAEGVPHWPDDDSTRPVLRAYTVRRFDRSRLRLEFDLALHGDGVGMRWLGQVVAGDVVGLSGMRPEFWPGGGVRRHLLIGDSAAAPAIAAIVESLPPDLPVTVYLASERASDLELLPRAGNIAATWVPDPAPVGPGSALARLVRRTERPVARTQAWLAAEAGVVRELRRFLLQTLGVDRDDLHASAYWKATLNSTQVDTAYLARYQREVADGADISDPDTRERVELDT